MSLARSNSLIMQRQDFRIAHKDGGIGVAVFCPHLRLLNAPLKRMHLAVVGMFAVESAQLKIGPVCRQSHAYPAGRSAGQEGIRRGRQVDEMNPAWLMLRDVPVVCMAVDDGFYLAAWRHFSH